LPACSFPSFLPSFTHPFFLPPFKHLSLLRTSFLQFSLYLVVVVTVVTVTVVTVRCCGGVGGGGVGGGGDGYDVVVVVVTAVGQHTSSQLANQPCTAPITAVLSPVSFAVFVAQLAVCNTRLRKPQK
jgi:hypothetical protein